MCKLDDKYGGLLEAMWDAIAGNDERAMDKLKLDEYYIDYDNMCLVFIKDGVIYEARLNKSYVPSPVR